MSTATSQPGVTASTAAGLTRAGMPQLTALRAKMRAKLLPTMAPTPEAGMAVAGCSREESVPKLFFTNSTVGHA